MRRRKVPEPRLEFIVRDSDAPGRRMLRTSTDVLAYWREKVPKEIEQEVFGVVLLDAKHRPKDALRIIGVGSLTAAIVHPREVFAPALRDRAAAIMLAHNHPSGDPAPSPEDVDLTRRLREVGEIIGIRVLDHVIVGGDQHFSFCDAGYW